MANLKYLDENGLLYYDGKVKARLNNKVDKETGKGLSTNDYTTAEKEKLASLENFELEPATSSALGGIKVGSNLSITSDGTLSADAQQIDVDSSLSSTSENPVQNKVIKGALDDKVDKEAGKGLSANDYTTAEKTKLGGIAEGAEVNQNAFSTITDGTDSINAGSKTATLTVNATGDATVSLSGTTLTIGATNTTYEEATTTTAGLMSAGDKTKLNGIEAGANQTIVDSALSADSENPVQNKVINTALSNKVDKETGKGLSTNDYTTAEKNKLANIAAGAEVNVLEGVKVNGTTLTITDKTVDIIVPTNNNQLTNGAGYQTASDVQTAIDEALEDITGIDFEVVQTLPQTGVKGTIYLVSNSGTAPNVYDEYIYVSDSWEKIGTTQVDLTNYVQFSDLVAITNAEIDTIIATNNA